MNAARIVVSLVAPLVALAWAAPCCAHAILVDSTPAVHARIPAGHEAVVLRFNSRIDRGRSRLTLIGADQAPVRLTIGASGPADVLDAAADLAPGAYTLRWQVLAVDGHITRGDVPFTVTAP